MVDHISTRTGSSPSLRSWWAPSGPFGKKARSNGSSCSSPSGVRRVAGRSGPAPTPPRRTRSGTGRAPGRAAARRRSRPWPRRRARCRGGTCRRGSRRRRRRRRSKVGSEMLTRRMSGWCQAPRDPCRRAGRARSSASPRRAPSRVATPSLPRMRSIEASRSAWLRQSSVTQITSGCVGLAIDQVELAAGVGLELCGGVEQHPGELLALAGVRRGLSVTGDLAHSARTIGRVRRRTIAITPSDR